MLKNSLNVSFVKNVFKESNSYWNICQFMANGLSSAIYAIKLFKEENIYDGMDNIIHKTKNRSTLKWNLKWLLVNLIQNNQIKDHYYHCHLKILYGYPNTKRGLLSASPLSAWPLSASPLSAVTAKRYDS